jgi:hypothetical protein
MNDKDIEFMERYRELIKKWCDEGSFIAMGITFENAFSRMLREDVFEILDYTSGFLDLENRPVTSKTRPDFYIFDHFTNTSFFVECKYRMNPETKRIHNLNADAYRAAAEMYGEETFMVIGLGGTPEKPNEIFVLDARKLMFDNINTDYLRKNFKLTGEINSIEDLRYVAETDEKFYEYRKIESYNMRS